jgi:uncharacterized protein YyaL (SSP411 family)
MLLAALLGLGLASRALAEDPAAAPQGPARANRLAQETSPYLLLHAHNPVDWYPWGTEALAKAKAEDKLIFLSIGYSSCHWCHVMERESFMDAEVAAVLNEHFVSIKVDREERPDIDEIYMTALQIYYQLLGSGQGGGWPLSMFLTPDGKPVVGGTYYPPRDREDFEGFLSVLTRVHKAWTDEPELVRRRGTQLADFVQRSFRQRPSLTPSLPTAERLGEVQDALADDYDPDHGGFGYSEVDPHRPKFPQPANLLFLIDRVRRHDDEDARRMLLGTLDRLAAGGIRDHLGGGFHRYSTDRYWHIPHFEKMLYDNAQLATVYAEAFRLTDRPAYRQVVEETLAFVSRELTDSAGGFYSALDADTDGKEGGYYVWDRSAVEAALGAEAFGPFAQVYGLAGEPNFEDQWALLVDRLPSPEADAQLVPAREKLLAVRSERARPLTDTKVLTGINGLMIRGFADSGRILKDDGYKAAAVQAADFVLRELRTQDGRLLRTWSQGQAKLNAYVEDYAYLVDGLIALHRATADERWLAEADRLTATQIEHFWDEADGGFYFTSDDHEALLARSKDPTDSATPSANAVTAGNLLYLAAALDKPDYRERAERTILAFGSLWDQAPAAMPRMATVLAELLDAPADSTEGDASGAP